MTKKKKTLAVNQIELTDFPAEMLVTPSQLPSLEGYDFQEKGTMFEGGVEFKLVVVTGQKLSEEPVDEQS